MVTEHPIATADSEPGPLILICHDPANFLAKFVRLISDPEVFWRAGIDARCGNAASDDGYPHRHGLKNFVLSSPRNVEWRDHCC